MGTRIILLAHAHLLQYNNNVQHVHHHHHGPHVQTITKPELTTSAIQLSITNAKVIQKHNLAQLHPHQRLQAIVEIRHVVETRLRPHVQTIV